MSDLWAIKNKNKEREEREKKKEWWFLSVSSFVSIILLMEDSWAILQPFSEALWLWHHSSGKRRMSIEEYWISNLCFNIICNRDNSVYHSKLLKKKDSCLRRACMLHEEFWTSGSMLWAWRQAVGSGTRQTGVWISILLALAVLPWAGFLTLQFLPL